MSEISVAWLLALGLFIGILILLELGRRIGERRFRRDPDGARAGTGAVEGAIFGLVGLLIAFTFSGAASRFDDRRELIVEETNAIGTAYLRLDLLPEGARGTMQERFRHYLDARIDAYRKLPDVEAARVVMTQANAMQGEIWTAAIAAAHSEGASPDALKLLLPALNDMFDITTTRTNATAIHPPMIIYGMLVVLTLAAALMAGYGMAGSKGRPWLHIVGFALVMALAVYIIIDLEYPRIGLIRVEGFDQALMNLRAGMK
ncbi:MAG: DUF4239 domain-containing protein [Thiocapsa sp.]|uniref:bestrophin-like domain n=1 Tax=Thiocapsa sp. TaxID=2024551 RepID=UPI001BCC8AC6|nr:DUF4239 domain-containing protein [Thiocapsa sp.]QVL48291.1 MAG: DUF4239 domain-containing protein [Thiocapsa sp.]